MKHDVFLVGTRAALVKIDWPWGLLPRFQTSAMRIDIYYV